MLLKVLLLIVLLMSSLLFLMMKFWFMMWIMMEISLLSFTFFLMADSKKFSSSVEVSMKYFLVQIIISIFILMSFMWIMKSQMEYMNNNIIFFMSILCKMSIFPFHWWMPLVAIRMQWWKMFVMISWLKIIPMYLLSFLNMNLLLILVMCLSIIFSTMIQYFFSLTKLIIVYSSIAHSSWILITIVNSFLISMIFLVIYSLVLMSVVKISKQTQLINLMQKINNSMNNKIQIMLVMLSLAGIPPLLGFLPKWIALFLMHLKMSNNFIVILIFFSMTTLNFYIYSRFLFYYFFQKSFLNWMFITTKNYSMLQWTMPMFLWLWCI